MKWIRSRAAVLCLMALLGASASACSPYDLQDLLQEEPENIESESVKDSHNQQKAEAPAADTCSWKSPSGNRFRWANMPMNIWISRDR